MEPRELLELLVDAVATLGKLVAAAAAPSKGMLLDGSPRSLHEALGTFISHLGVTLNSCSVTSWDHGNVTSLGLLDFSFLGQFSFLLGRWGAVLRHRPRAPALGQALASPGATWADVTAVASAWQERVATLTESWSRLAGEATELRNCWVRAAVRRGPQAAAPLGLLERLVAACDSAIMFPLELQHRLGDIRLALAETREPSACVPEALVAAVAEAERLWEASALLASRHLLGALGDIRGILNSFLCGPGDTADAERCQKAIKDIPTLLQEQ